MRGNAILPGIVDTGFHANSGKPNRFAESGALKPMGRGGNPDTIAKATMRLLGEKNTFSNGT